MVNIRHFKKYYFKLALEGMIKALICGFITGFAVSFVSALIVLLVNKNGLWLSLINYKGLWLSIVAGILAVIATVPLFYFTMFRPKSKQIAERIDRLGLDERLITMLELEKEDSYIAMRQREDAQAKLSANRKPLRLSIFIAPVVAVVITAVCSGFMLAISNGSFNGRLFWMRPGERLPYDDSYFSVSYTVYDGKGNVDYDGLEVSWLTGAGGYIKGDFYQLIFGGQDAKKVTAVADVGYGFIQWSDGVKTAERNDIKVQQDIAVFAVFSVLRDGGGGNTPPPRANNDESDETGGGDPLNNDNAMDDERYNALNKIIDEKTYYREVYSEYYEKAMKILSEGGEVPADVRAIVELYYDIII